MQNRIVKVAQKSIAYIMDRCYYECPGRSFKNYQNDTVNFRRRKKVIKMRNNDFITRNFTAGNSVATINNAVTGTAPLNIVVFGVQAVDTAGKYLSKLSRENMQI